MTTLRQRAFELQDLEFWCNRNSHRLTDVHSRYWYARRLEELTKVDWEHYETEAEFLRETEGQWVDYKAQVRAAFM